MGHVRGSSLVLVLGLACAGCSFVFMDAAPAHHEKLLYFDCTSTRGPVLADGALGTLFALGAASEISPPGGKQQYGTGSGGAIDLALTGVLASSTVYGLVRTEECRRAKAALRRRLIDFAERDQRARAQRTRHEGRRPPAR